MHTNFYVITLCCYKLHCFLRVTTVPALMHCVLYVSACPAAVCVEVSRDGATSFPVCAPISTSGLTLIKVQLLNSEVVTSVTIRLHKPRDSTTIGLSQIMLLGLTVFGSAGNVRAGNVMSPSSSMLTGIEDYVSKTR